MPGTPGEVDRANRTDGAAPPRADPGATGRPGGPAPQGGGGAGRGPGAAGAGGEPRSDGGQSSRRRLLSAAWRIFRKVAMIGPSYEELRRMEEEDRRANTEWLPGGRIGLVHGFSEFGARRED